MRMKTKVDRPIIALDPSSTACGWSLFRGVVLLSHGTVKRGKRTLTEYANDCAREIRRAVVSAGCRLIPFPEVYYEINRCNCIRFGKYCF